MVTRDSSVLLVEDDDVEVMSVLRALRRHDLDIPVHVARNGQEALEHLRSSDGADEQHRFLVLLDINMPRMNGHEFLRELRDDLSLRSAVVMMFTTSDDPSDIQRAYDRGVAGYIVKSDLSDNYSQLGKLLDEVCNSIRLPDITMAASTTPADASTYHPALR